MLIIAVNGLAHSIMEKAGEIYAAFTIYFFENLFRIKNWF